MTAQTGKNKLVNSEKLLFILLVFLAGLWFYVPGRYILYANEDLKLFEKSASYLLSFFDRPGGVLEYLAGFLSQFYRYSLAGALVLGVLIAVCAISVHHLFSKLSGRKVSMAWGIVAALLMVGMHNFYPHQLSHSLGFLLSISGASFIPERKGSRILFMALGIPLIYFLSGGFIWIFALLALMVFFKEQKKPDFQSILFVLTYSTIVFLAAALFYLQPWKELIVIQLPMGPAYGSSPWPMLFLSWILLGLLFMITRAGSKINGRWKLGMEAILCLGAGALILHFSYHRKNAEFFRIEKMAIEQEWDALLEYTEKHPSTNLFGSFYTNLALANKGLLCEELFRYPQGFGRRGLCFGWEEKEEILRRGSDFFWTIHYVNEAHHWAFESLIIEGPTRRNLNRLIQTELIRGNYRVAQKYIDQLNRSLFQRKLADHYYTFLDHPDSMIADPELGPRMNSEMKSDFFAEGADLEKNLRSVLANHPSRRPAIDYLMALYLLEKNVEKIHPLLPYFREGHGGTLPSLLDESLIVYQITHREEAPSGLQVSPSTLKRFEEYTKVLRQYRNPEDAARMLYPGYGHTFWFHLNFKQ